MAIKPSHDADRVVTAKEKNEEITTEMTLRPRYLAEYIGQGQIKEHLIVAIESARIRKSPLEHILFYGPP